MSVPVEVVALAASAAIGFTLGYLQVRRGR
jgi:hypothetical protein